MQFSDGGGEKEVAGLEWDGCIAQVKNSRPPIVPPPEGLSSGCAELTIELQLPCHS